MQKVPPFALVAHALRGCGQGDGAKATRKRPLRVVSMSPRFDFRFGMSIRVEGRQLHKKWCLFSILSPLQGFWDFSLFFDLGGHFALPLAYGFSLECSPGRGCFLILNSDLCKTSQPEPDSQVWIRKSKSQNDEIDF